MLTLAFETSAKAASVALMENGKLLGESYQNTGLTHSQTLLTMAEELLKSCYIEGVTDLASKDIARAEEEEALSKCRAVIEAVQQGSYKIVTQHTSGRNESAVSHEWIYSRNGSDWLSITNVLPMGADFNDDVEYAATNSALCTNGQHYKDTGTEWVEIANQEDSRLPWLADFSWDENIISYQGTIEDSGAVFVMLRVDEKYLNSDEYGPHYFVDFSFYSISFS